MRSSLLNASMTAVILIFSACGGCDSEPDPNNQPVPNNEVNNGPNNTTNNANNQTTPNNIDNPNNLNNPNTNQMTCGTTNFVGTVSFKRGRRLGNDMAQALAISEQDLCRELGQFDCVDFVHRVALGDPEPYTAGMYEPLQNTTTSTTLVVERIAMSGCAQRVDADLAAPMTAVIFQGISTGTLDPNAPEVDAATIRLYQRALLRDPSDTELGIVRDFYPEVAATSDDPARDWAVLACFSVLTSTEFLFY